MMNLVNASNDDNDDVTAVTYNTTKHKNTLHKQVQWIAETARQLYGNPVTQYLKALTIATSKAIADTGATSIFVNGRD